MSKCFISILLLNIALGVCLSTPTNAMADYNLPQLVQMSDTICIGVADKIEVQPQKHPINTSMQTIPENTSSADFVIESTLKGRNSATSQIQIIFQSNINLRGTNVLRSAELVEGQRVLIFLSRGLTPNQFVLTAPFSVYPPIIPLGLKECDSPPQGSTPFRQVVSVLVASLNSKDTTIQINSLLRLREGSYIFFLPDSSFVDYSYAKQLRKELNEPQLPSLETFAEQIILNPLKSLTTALDNDVASNAVITDAAFQDPDIISRLVTLAETKQTFSTEALMRLSDYRVSQSVKPLVSALQSKDDLVRANAAHSLRGIGDPSALPFLSEHLSDNNREVRFWVVGAFAITTGDLDWLPTTKAFAQNNSRFVSHWKQWVVQNQNRLKILRAQSDTVAPVRAAH